MAGFLYLIKGSHQAKDVTPDLIERHGLTYAFEGKPSLCGCRNLPPEFGGGEFTVLADPRSLTDATAHFDASKQTWRKIPKKEAWIGVVNASRPTPADLVRKHQIMGHMVTLGDGHRWMIPMERKYELNGTERAFMSVAPQTYDVDDDGSWFSKPMDEFAPLIEISEFAIRSVMTANDGDGSTAEAWGTLHQLCCKAIGMNYRVGEIEAAVLGLLNDTVMWEAILAVIDWPSYVEIQKKSLQGS